MEKDEKSKFRAIILLVYYYNTTFEMWVGILKKS